jgi:hypothetical protein
MTPTLARQALWRIASLAAGHQRRKAEHPPVDSHVVDLDPALSEELLDITVGQAEVQVPADSDDDDIGREPESGEADRGGIDGRER